LHYLGTVKPKHDIPIKKRFTHTSQTALFGGKNNNITISHV